MNLKTKTCWQLAKMIRRGHPLTREAAIEWAERIEGETGNGKPLTDAKRRKLALCKSSH